MPVELENTELTAVAAFLQAPSPATYGMVFRLFAPRLLRYFRLRGCDPFLAEDLAQDVMLAVFREVGSLRGPQSFRPWVYRIARNTHLMHLRKLGRAAETIELEALGSLAPGMAPQGYAQSLLHESLATLDPLSYRVFALRYLDGLEYHEIAEVLDMPLGTVQWKVFECKRKLALMMKDR